MLDQRYCYDHQMIKSMQTYRLYNKLIIPVLNILILFQDITVELLDSSCQPEKLHVLTPPTRDIDHTSDKLFQEAISLDFEEIIENRVTMETSNNTQSTTSTINKLNTSTMTEAHSILGLSPNQPIIHSSEGSTCHVPPNSHVSVCPPVHISDSMAGNGIEPEEDPWNEDTDDFDSLMDEEALMKVDILCQETHERVEEVEVTKKTMTISDEDDEVLVISDDELVEQDSGVKTLQDIAEEEEKDIYDPTVLGMLIHCHLFVSLFISSFIPSSVHLFSLSIHPFFYPSIYPFILPFIHPFIHSSFLLSIHLSIDPSFYPSIYLFVLSSIHPFIHSFIYYIPFIHLSSYLL